MTKDLTRLSCLKDSFDEIVLSYTSLMKRLSKLKMTMSEVRKQSSTETREDTREQAPPDTRVEAFDQPRDPLSSLPDAPKSFTGTDKVHTRNE